MFINLKYNIKHNIQNFEHIQLRYISRQQIAYKLAHAIAQRARTWIIATKIITFFRHTKDPFPIQTPKSKNKRNSNRKKSTTRILYITNG